MHCIVEVCQCLVIAYVSSTTNDLKKMKKIEIKPPKINKKRKRKSVACTSTTIAGFQFLEPVLHMFERIKPSMWCDVV